MSLERVLLYPQGAARDPSASSQDRLPLQPAFVFRTLDALCAFSLSLGHVDSVGRACALALPDLNVVF